MERSKISRFLSPVGRFVFCGLVITSFTAQAQYFAFERSRAEKLQQEILSQDLLPALSSPELKKTKIAIFDNGFGTYAEGDKNLPATTKLIADPCAAIGSPDKGEHLSMADHGLAMAETVWAMTGLHAENAPQLFLVNAYYWKNLKCAIDWAIANKIDIILHSMTYELGNLDGTGFVNEKVNRATSAGILWVNAAGNYHDLVYTGPVVSQKGWLKFHYSDKPTRDFLRLHVDNDSTSLTMTLSWNDLPQDESVATTKDLDLKLYDSHGKEVTVDHVENGKTISVPAVTNWRSDGQGKEHPPTGDTRGYSTLPREQVGLVLNRGDYRIRIQDRSGNFGKNDKVRLLIFPNRDYDFATNSMGIQFPDKTFGYEIFAPADNTSVFTVGDTSLNSRRDASPISALGPNIDGYVKPDVLIGDSRIELTNGNKGHFGSSTAAAIFAGFLADWKVMEPGLDSKDVEKFLHDLKKSQGKDMPVLFNPNYQEESDNKDNRGQPEQRRPMMRPGTQPQGDDQGPYSQGQPNYRGQPRGPGQQPGGPVAPPQGGPFMFPLPR